MKSLDPRVRRLPLPNDGILQPKAPLDQFGTYEVFVQPKEGKVFQHEGIVHAPNIEMAFVLAKEAFTRRFLCTSLYVVDTRNVLVSPMTEGIQSVYDLIPDAGGASGTDVRSFEIYHLIKRGKQHTHAGTVTAATAQEAMAKLKLQFRDKVVYNIWAIATESVRFTTPEEGDFWKTLPEKKFRDASDYKGGDKLKEFLERSAK